jgi:hypothetical protein
LAEQQEKHRIDRYRKLNNLIVIESPSERPELFNGGSQSVSPFADLDPFDTSREHSRLLLWPCSEVDCEATDGKSEHEHSQYSDSFQVVASFKVVALFRDR